QGGPGILCRKFRLTLGRNLEVHANLSSFFSEHW
ncbi:MAG: hypothetical protein ACI8W7_002366, partial [Gammaproteobacteria bacterium]